MSVHYRFKSALEYDTITFDGLHISVKDLKNAIIQQKRIGKSTDFDLKITNAQTQEGYEDENALIPKNTSLLIARVPVTAPKQKQWEGYGGNDTPPAKVDEGGPVGKTMDLANLDAPEDDKIQAMMSQSTQDYDPSNYVKIRGANQVGPVPATYRCYKCHQNGHWIKDCPVGQGVDPVEIKKSTGIPHSFMVPVDGPQVHGAMMMSNGQYAVPALDLQAYNQKHPGPNPLQEPKPEIPEDLLCSICSDLLADAVMIPCCGNSFCDECVRSVLLESEEHECPDCHEKDISPGTLIPNRFLRKSVANFKNTTGYEKKPIFRPKPDIVKEDPIKKDLTPPPVVESTEKDNLKEEEKTVISEADSTDHGKNEKDFSKETELELPKPKTDESEGPPGVSPRVSPKNSPIHRSTIKVSKDKEKPSKEKEHRSSKSHKHRRSRTPSPRKSRNRRSPSFETRRSPDRHGTPIRDEPPGLGGNYAPPSTVDAFSGPPGAHPGNVMPQGGPPMQGPPIGVPPGAFPQGQPPPFHPGNAPPNFRMPPPGSQPPPYMAPGPYPVQPRPVFDPMGGPPGNFGPNFGGRPRDFGGRRGGRDRTPPGVIDDPLAAFNRILREKDEKRARQQRMAAAARRSWSRSRSRSRSYSRSPPPLRRRGSRSPRRRSPRSRSRSFSMSRSRSRSYSHSPRGSPLPPLRRSPPPLQARRGTAQRFRSPHRSPPSRRRVIDRNNDFDRDYDRGNFRDKPRSRRADSRDRFYDDRDRDYDRGGTARGRVPPPLQAPTQQPLWNGPRENYFPPQDQPGPGGYQNRFPQQIHHIQPERKYEIIAPPGVEQPPIPGLESELPPVNDYQKQKKQSPQRKEKDRHNSPREHERDRDRKERDRRRDSKRSRSRTPENYRNPSPKSSGTPERPRKRRMSSDSKDEKKREKDRHRDHSEEERKKTKDKKKHRDKKDDKKKKKDKKDKHHKSKDKKEKKEEFKQVIPKTSAASDEDPDKVRKKIEERKKQREEEENKKLQEERKKEERRLRFLEDEKRKKEEEARKEEAKRKSIDEARRILEEEERQRVEKEPEQKIHDLYDEVIPVQDLAKEIHDDFNPLTEEQLYVAPEIQEQPDMKEPKSAKEREMEEGEVTDDQDTGVTTKEGEEEDSGVLELHSDMDIKLDETDILAPVPEKSKWEVDEDGQLQSSPSDTKELNDSKSKVSSEVLKRAENVIFARAINSIRPIEIKKITGERAKLYADEKPAEDPKKIEVISVEKPARLSVKERLGKKVDEPEPKIIIIDGPRSTSPALRRDRRIEVESNKRHDRRHSRPTQEHSRDRDRHRGRNDRSTDKNKKNRREEKEDKRHEERTKERRKRTRSPSEDPKKKKKDRKVKKEKEKIKKPEELKSEAVEDKPKSAVEKRKPTLDEASFEPDYDLELHDDEVISEQEKETTKKEVRKSEVSEEDSSSSESSSSSSEEERKRKKRKARKKKKRRETSSSESESSSDSSDSEKERKRKKHKKAKKKKKRAKHK